jgi:hypothetical protein
MELTRRRAIELSIELWTWLAKTGKEKREWPGWIENGGIHPKVALRCFLCEYSGVTGFHSCLDGTSPGEDRCIERCPYGSNYGFCAEDERVYSSWEDAESIEEKKEFAQLFLEQLETLRELVFSLTEEEKQIVADQCSMCPWGGINEGCLYQGGKFPHPIDGCGYYYYGEDELEGFEDENDWNESDLEEIDTDEDS